MITHYRTSNVHLVIFPHRLKSNYHPQYWKGPQDVRYGKVDVTQMTLEDPQAPILESVQYRSKFIMTFEQLSTKNTGFELMVEVGEDEPLNGSIPRVHMARLYVVSVSS